MGQLANSLGIQKSRTTDIKRSPAIESRCGVGVDFAHYQARSRLAPVNWRLGNSPWAAGPGPEGHGRPSNAEHFHDIVAEVVDDFNNDKTADGSGTGRLVSLFMLSPASTVKRQPFFSVVLPHRKMLPRDSAIWEGIVCLELASAVEVERSWLIHRRPQRQVAAP